MQAVICGQEDEPPAPSSSTGPRSIPDAVLPASVEAVLWRGTDLSPAATHTISSGFEALDAQLPGGGWPTGSVTELLQPQPSVLEWRLLGPALQALLSARRPLVLIGPPKAPHLPGLLHAGIDQDHLVWVQADTPAERLWCTEQLVKANAAAAIVAWLPQCRAEHLRRLQVAAHGCESPVFAFRPHQARFEPSPAPLRVLATPGAEWEMQIQILKRRGPALDDVLRLRSVPGGLSAVLVPATEPLDQPVNLWESNDDAAVVRPAFRRQRQRLAH